MLFHFMDGETEAQGGLVRMPEVTAWGLSDAKANLQAPLPLALLLAQRGLHAGDAATECAEASRGSGQRSGLARTP